MFIVDSIHMGGLKWGRTFLLSWQGDTLRLHHPSSYRYARGERTLIGPPGADVQQLRHRRAGPGWLRFDQGTFYLNESRCEAALASKRAEAFTLRLRFAPLPTPAWVSHPAKDYFLRHLRAEKAVFWRIRVGNSWRCQKWRVLPGKGNQGSLRHDWVRPKQRSRGYDAYYYKYKGTYLSLMSYGESTRSFGRNVQIASRRIPLCTKARLVTAVKRDRAIVGGVIWYFTSQACRSETTIPSATR